MKPALPKIAQNLGSLILTARMDQATFNFFNDLRTQYFPKKINYLSAHITLFNAIPSSIFEEFRVDLTKSIECRTHIDFTFGPVFSLGRGVAYKVNCPPLSAQREIWRKAWSGQLTRQDNGMNRTLHITVQNKVRGDVARETLHELSNLRVPLNAQIVGYDIHEYLGGPWRWIQGWNLP